MNLTGWAQSGGLITGDRNGISCQAQFSTDSVYTIQFGVSVPSNTIIRTEAEISMNINGNDIRRRVSAINGMSFSGTSRSVTVKLYDALTAGMPGVLGVPYVGNIQISRGVRPATDKPPTLIPDQYINVAGATLPYVGIIPVPPTNSAAVLVPENAGLTSVLVTASTQNSSTPAGAIYVAASQVSVAAEVSLYDPREHDFMPLWPGVNRINLYNNSADPADIVNFAVIFGVDG